MALFNRDEIPNEEPEDDEYLPEDYPPNPSRKPKNHPLRVLIILLGVVLLLALAALVIFAPRFLEARRTERLNQAAYLNAINTATAMAAGMGTDELAFPEVDATVEATGAPLETPGLSADELATVSALQTQMALQPGVETSEPAVVTSVPETQQPTSSGEVAQTAEPPATEQSLTTTEVAVNQTASPATASEEPAQATQVSGLDVASETPLPVDGTATVETPRSEAVVVEATGTEVLPTELPDTGVGDNLRLPLLVGVAVLLILMIILSRRLRLSSR